MSAQIRPSRRRRYAAATLLAAAGAVTAAALGAASPADAQPSPQANPSPDHFVAISYSPETHTWGTGWNFTNLDSARIRSLSECQNHGGNHCVWLAWSQNGCAALAVNGDNYYGWYGPTPYDAQQGALQRNGGGQIVVTQCAT
ncbi:MAG TPA: DUF4189 domain-containing protein [Mycobacterium sp.]|nr:DUF4189 domain-containing protein [Mycobacterium sp.]